MNIKQVKPEICQDQDAKVLRYLGSPDQVEPAELFHQQWSRQLKSAYKLINGNFHPIPAAGLRIIRQDHVVVLKYLNFDGIRVENKIIGEHLRLTEVSMNGDDAYLILKVRESKKWWNHVHLEFLNCSEKFVAFSILKGMIPNN